MPMKSVVAFQVSFLQVLGEDGADAALRFAHLLLKGGAAPL